MVCFGHQFHVATKVEPRMVFRQVEPHLARLDVDIDSMNQRKTDRAQVAKRPECTPIFENYGVVLVPLGSFDERDLQLGRAAGCRLFDRFNGLTRHRGGPEVGSGGQGDF